MDEKEKKPESKPSTSKAADEKEIYNTDSDGSADSSEVDKCPICLLAFKIDQEIGKPGKCDHVFCFPCIAEWSKVMQTCPIDRIEFQEIRVYGNVECEGLLRTVVVKEKVALNEFISGEELTACEFCERTDREDCMLLCDGCDKGFHMDCLDPPLIEIPQENWYCDDCAETSDESEDEDEVDDLNNDVECDMVELAETRLRSRQQQPQILRTLQSERIRNAILARMSLRSTRASFGEGPSLALPAARPKRKIKRRRRRARTVVVEYDVDGSDKFAMKRKRVTKKYRRRKKRKSVGKTAKRKSRTSTGPSTSSGFKSSNANVHELQRGRMMAGLTNFNIFEPTHLLDYVPDDDDIVEDSGIDDGSAGGVLTQAIIGISNPQRRNMIIKNRVLQNCTTTSRTSDLLDSIMQDQSMFGPGSIRDKFTLEKSSGKLLFVGKSTDSAKKASGGDGNQPPGDIKRNETGSTSNPSTSQQPVATASVAESGTSHNDADANTTSDDRIEPQNVPSEPSTSQSIETTPDKKKKTKKPAFDMFDENSNNDDCPNFSIYDSVDHDPESSSNFQSKTNVYDEENVDLVQMSDNEQQNESLEEVQPAIVSSQPASPDLDNDVVEELPERSYTPPIAQKTSEDGPDKDDNDKKKKDRDSKRSRKRELERYNVRDRLKERSPAKIKDKFGRNRSRSRSGSRKKQARRRSPSRDRMRKSKSFDRHHRKSRSLSRSRSRRRTPSIEYDRKKKPTKEKIARPSRRSRSRSPSPRHHRPTTPDRRARSRSRKAKKKKHSEHNKDKPSTLTKEVFTSGQNILVSVNFNNKEDKSGSRRSKSRERLEPKEIVDITARKKITINSKPVAIIDLARSPFRELTPEYKTNVIELSDSDGERTEKNQPKSPDSTLSSKLYDPFDILNSPTNENVTSSQTSAALHQKLPEKVPEPVKLTMNYNKNVMALAASTSLFFNEENLVTSSSTLATSDKQQLILSAAAKANLHQNISKNDAVPMEIAESPYSPGHEYDDAFPHHEESPKGKQTKGGNKMFEDLFGTSSPPGLDRAKNSKKGEKSGDHSNKYLMKLKRQERVIEEVKLVMKPFYSNRVINKEQYKEILRKAVPKICHSREINPQKIKVLIDSYVKIFKHRKKRSAPEENF